jgi:hypothetical protein
MDQLPAIDTAKARLPATYEQAKAALASCAKLDEVKDIADKAEALATYAKMANDNSLRLLADRIQARAVRRLGELLKQFNAQGKRTDQLKEGTLQKLTQKEAADSAGISEHQRKQATRVANIPDDKFESAVEAEKPATVTKLAEMGKAPTTTTTTTEKPATVTKPTAKQRALEEFCGLVRRVQHLLDDLLGGLEVDSGLREKMASDPGLCDAIDDVADGLFYALVMVGRDGGHRRIGLQQLREQRQQTMGESASPTAPAQAPPTAPAEPSTATKTLIWMVTSSRFADHAKHVCTTSESTLSITPMGTGDRFTNYTVAVRPVGRDWPCVIGRFGTLAAAKAAARQHAGAA